MKTSGKNLVSSFAFCFMCKVLHQRFAEAVKALDGVLGGHCPHQVPARSVRGAGVGCPPDRAGEGKRDVGAIYHFWNL